MHPSRVQKGTTIDLPPPHLGGARNPLTSLSSSRCSRRVSLSLYLTPPRVPLSPSSLRQVPHALTRRPLLFRDKLLYSTVHRIFLSPVSSAFPLFDEPVLFILRPPFSERYFPPGALVILHSGGPRPRSTLPLFSLLDTSRVAGDSLFFSVLWLLSLLAMPAKRVLLE